MAVHSSMLACRIFFKDFFKRKKNLNFSSLDYSLLSYSFTSIHSYKDHLPKTCLGQKREKGSVG